MAGQILLVHDDIATIATVRRLLAREGYDVVLATSAADALIAFGHHLPSVLILAPGVEGDRGQLVLEELAQHPDAALARVLLLGESVPGFSLPVAPLPIDGTLFLDLVRSQLRGGSAEGAVVSAASLAPLETGGASADTQASGLEATLFGDLVGSGTDPRGGFSDPDLSAALETAQAEAEAATFASLNLPLRPDPDDGPAEALPPSDYEEQGAGLARALSTRDDEESTDPSATALTPDAELAAEHRAQREAETQRLKAELAARWGEEPTQFSAPALDEPVPVPTRRSFEGSSERTAEQLAETRQLAELAQRAREEATAATQRAEAEAAGRREAEEARRHAEDTLARLREESEAEQHRLRNEADLEQQRLRDAADARALEDAEVSRASAEAAAAAREDAERAREEARAATRDHEEAAAAAREAVERAQEDARLASRAHAEAQARYAHDSELEHARAEEAEAESARLKSIALAERSATEAALAAAESARRRAEREELELEHARGAHAELSRELLLLRAEADHSAHVAEAARLHAEVQEHARHLAERAAEAAREETRRREHELAASEQRHLTLEAKAFDASTIPGAARVTLEGLAALVLRLHRGAATVRLELKAPDALRVLFLEGGRLRDAVSSIASEGLLERAHRDGLIDSRQVRELRLLRSADETELLRALLERGYVRELEAVPLFQRYTEQVALEALSEPACAYRLTFNIPPGGLHGAASPRPLPALITESLRRGLTPEAVAERTRGLSAIATALGPFDDGGLGGGLELGWTEKEQRVLDQVDGESTLQSILLAAGVKQDVGLRTLAVAQVLGLLRVDAPAAPDLLPQAAELEVKRLGAKYDEAEEGDYFTVLGLPRDAGSDEVSRAYRALAEEFHPLRFAGHPDPGLQHRAQALHAMLAEAHEALSNDRLRQRYARSLVD